MALHERRDQATFPEKVIASTFGPAVASEMIDHFSGHHRILRIRTTCVKIPIDTTPTIERSAVTSPVKLQCAVGVPLLQARMLPVKQHYLYRNAENLLRSIRDLLMMFTLRCYLPYHSSFTNQTNKICPERISQENCAVVRISSSGEQIPRA